MQMYGMSGEPLGTIGRPNVPQWKKDFLAKPSASVRKGIAWGFDAPYEDCDVLVLTAPSGKFVDIRVPVEAKVVERANEHPSFWAFCGTTSTTFYDKLQQQVNTVDLPFTAHCKFSHDVDSRGVEISDEGDMFLLPNGSCIETGIMLNPSTGTLQLYKEYWCSADGMRDEDRNVCVVAEPVSGTRVQGLIVRLGGRLQAIWKSEEGTSVSVERWMRERTRLPAGPSTPHGSRVSWTSCYGSGTVPCEWFASSNRAVGDKISVAGTEWQITEMNN